MKKILLVIFQFVIFLSLNAEENLKYYVGKAFENNLQLNAERKNLESAKQSNKISNSEFLPRITISGNQTTTDSTNRTNQSGVSLTDSKTESETQTISLEQTIFSGFKGINTFKKSELEEQKAKLELKQTEQITILNTAKAYFDFIYKSKNEQFNLSNVNLFERQVESDSARLQKGEITLTDLAQSESSLAGAKANLIKANTELFTSKTNFQRVTGEQIPKFEDLEKKALLQLPALIHPKIVKFEKLKLSYL